MKRRIRLNEGSLKRMIKESVRQVLNEGHSDGSVYEKWERAEEMMGASAMLSALWSFLGSDTIDDFIETLERVYELPLGGSYDDEDDDYDEDYEDDDY